LQGKAVPLHNAVTLKLHLITLGAGNGADRFDGLFNLGRGLALQLNESFGLSGRFYFVHNGTSLSES
jgi:hypothetical protein